MIDCPTIHVVGHFCDTHAVWILRTIYSDWLDIWVFVLGMHPAGFDCADIVLMMNRWLYPRTIDKQFVEMVFCIPVVFVV